MRWEWPVYSRNRKEAKVAEVEEEEEVTGHELREEREAGTRSVRAFLTSLAFTQTTEEGFGIFCAKMDRI